MQRKLKISLCLHARLCRTVDNVGSHVQNIGNEPETVVEYGQDIEETAEHHDNVVEPDDPVVAPVRTNVAFVLHHNSSCRDGAAFKPEQLAEHAEPRAILHYLVTTWCGAALRADVALAASVPRPITSQRSLTKSVCKAARQPHGAAAATNVVARRMHHVGFPFPAIVVGIWITLFGRIAIKAKDTHR